MIVSAYYLKDALCSVQVLEALRPVSALVIVKAQIRVAVSQLRVVISKDLLLDDDALGLQLDCLQVVAHLVLDVGHLCNAICHLWIHGSSHLEQEVDDLVIEVESFLKLALSAGSSRLLHHLGRILILVVEMLDDREEIGDDTALERHVGIVVQLLIADELGLLLMRLLLLLLLFLVPQAPLVLRLCRDQLP